MDIVKGEPTEPRQQISSDVILIGSDQLGTGDRKLGELMMLALLNTLCDSETKPARLIFVNSGVKLTVEGSAVLETLQLLEEDKVEILSCGTCLEYYHLKEKLMVGRVTTMHDTVESLLSAAKVIAV